MLSKNTLALASMMVASTYATTISPNPGSQSADNGISSAEISDCLQKGNNICKDLSTNALQCVTNSADSKLSSTSYLCTNKYTDKIMAHSIANIANEGTCPTNLIGEKIGAKGTLTFPHGKQKCSVMITAKCGAPTFQISTDSKRADEDYEIYWTEWDGNLIEKPIEYVDLSIASDPIVPSMAPTLRWPRFDQVFYYEGLGSEYSAGYPGDDGSGCENYWGFNCWFGAPDSQKDFNQLRALKYGLGQPSSG